MPLHLTAEHEQRLKQLAAQTGRTSDELAQEALDGYLKHVEPLMADIREAEESAEREGWPTNEEVFESLNERLMKPARGSSTTRATYDLNAMVDFIGQNNPDAAIRVANRIYDQVMQLAPMPTSAEPVMSWEPEN
jgi:predicted transcriptional regulator